MNFTLNELAAELKADGTVYHLSYGDTDEFYDFWYEVEVGNIINTLAFGEFEVVEAEVGKCGEIKDDLGGGGNVWHNWIILKQDDRFFRLNGEYDSWDAQGWDGRVEEVEPVEKTITVWEKKIDY